MESNGKNSNTGDFSMTENKTGDVILRISDEVEAVKNATPGTPRDEKHGGISSTESPHRKSVDSNPENAYFMPSPNISPKIPNPETPTRLKTLARSMYSKPKSRFGEQPIIDHNMFNGTPRTLSITPKTPLMASPGRYDEDDEEIYKKVYIEFQLKSKRAKMKVLFDWVLLILLVGCIVTSLKIPKLENYKIWGLELWKWFVLITVIMCGMLVTKWLMNIIIWLIEMNFTLKKKVLYIAYGQKNSVQLCIWFSVILVTWASLFNSNHIDRSKTATKVFDYLTWTIVALLIGSVLWLLKSLFLKFLEISFHSEYFLDRVQESVFLQSILHTLSGPPTMESLESIRMKSSLNFRASTSKSQSRVLNVGKLHQIKQDVSAWILKMWVNAISNAYYESGDIVTSEMEATVAGYHIFRNVAQPGSRYIFNNDLRRFMIDKDVDTVLEMIDVYEQGQINQRTLIEWVVKVYNERKTLARNTSTAVNELNKLVRVFLIIIIIVVWLLLTEIASTKVLVLISSQLVVAAFIFGNTCKSVFEGLVFVFIMHPFDVGDRCVVDGVQMLVEEMHILTTVFLRFDNEKMYYPNSVLATKTISNLYRSPNMSDSVEFSIDFATPIEKIALLKVKLKMYLEKNPHLWHPNHNFVVKDIENENKIKLALLFNHTINFQNYNERTRRRGELILELKKIFEEFKIKCYHVPQEVQLSNPETTATPPTAD